MHTFISEQFGRHVVWCSTFLLVAVAISVSVRWLCRLRSLQIRQLARQAKVAELECAILIHQHIRGFQIAVDDAVRMQVVKALRKISSKLSDRVFWQLLIQLDHLKQVPTRTVLEDDPQVVPRLVPIVEFQNVPVLQIVKDFDLQDKHLLSRRPISLLLPLTSLRTFFRRFFSTDLTATYSIVFFLRPFKHRDKQR